MSIGVPVYNGEPFLRETLDCLVNQTWRDSEIIISDNASTDATPDICRAYAAADPRVRYLRSETNRGSAWNFNHVIRLAEGEYFKLANADDLCAPTLVEQCVDILDNHPEVVVCYGKTTLIDGSDRRLSDYEDRLDLRDADSGERFMATLHRLGLVNILQGLVRRNILMRTPLMGDYLGSDMVLVAELALYGQFHEIGERLFFRRMHSGAFSGLDSVDAQVEYMVPTQKGKADWYFCRHLVEYVRAVWRAPLGLAQKVTLTGRVVRHAVSTRDKLGPEVCGGLATIWRRPGTWRKSGGSRS